MKITKNNLEAVFKSKIKSIEEVEASGYKFLENCFVDSSGFGAEDEPAMTVKQFTKRIEELVNTHEVIYTYITNAGQFQVNMGVYVK